MATRVSALLAEGKKAAADLHSARRHAHEVDGTEEEMVEAWASVDAAEQRLHAVNRELYQHTGQTVREDGAVVEGYPNELDHANGDESPSLSVGLSDEAWARLELGGAEETAEMSEAEVLEAAKELEEIEISEEIENILAADRRPIVGVDPGEATEEDTADDLDLYAARAQWADIVGKDPSDLTREDILDLQEQAEAENLARHTGVEAEHLTDVEKAIAKGEIRGKLHDEQAKELKEEAGDGSGTVTGNLSGTGSGTGGGWGHGRAEAAPKADPPLDSDRPGAAPDRTPSPAPEPARTAPEPTATSGTAPDVADTAPPTGPPAAGPPAADQPAADPVDQTPEPAPAGGGRDAPVEAPPRSAPEGTDAPGQGPITAVYQASFSGTDVYRAEDGTWYDSSGNHITDPAALETLEAIYDTWSDLNDALGEEVTSFETGINPTGASHEEAVAEAEGQGGSESGSSGDSADTSEDDEDDGDEDEDEEDGEDGDDEGSDDEQAAEEDSGEAKTDEGDDSEDGEGGDAGTPTPDDIGRPDAASREAFLSSPVGKETDELHAEAARSGAGGGLIDVEVPSDRSAWYESELSAQERHLAEESVEMGRTGGHTDPPDHGEFNTGAGAPVDGLAMAGGGTIDPVDAAPGRAPVDNPILGPPGIAPGGGTSRELDFGSGSGGGASSDAGRAEDGFGGHPDDEPDFDPLDPDDPDDPVGSKGSDGLTDEFGDEGAVTSGFVLQIDDSIADTIDSAALDGIG